MAVVGPESIVPLPFGYLRTLVRKCTRDQHHKLWQDTGERIQSKEALWLDTDGLADQTARRGTARFI